MREVAIRHVAATRRRGGEAARRGRGKATRGDEATRRRDETARRRDDDGDRNDAQANDDQNGIEQATLGPHRGFRLKQRGNDTTLTAMASTAVSGFRNHRPRRVALFNFTLYVASRSDYRSAYNLRGAGR